ncbi:hypothetical protein BHE74_00009205, partial [Ensete ventricosum]
EQLHPRAPLVALKDSTVGDLYIELVATFDLEHHTCSNLAIEEVICAARIYENGDGLLFEKSPNFHRPRVGVTGQRVHCKVGQLGFSSVASSSGLRLSSDGSVPHPLLVQSRGAILFCNDVLGSMVRCIANTTPWQIVLEARLLSIFLV